MQTPFPTPNYSPPAPVAPRKKTGKWLALGCGVPVGALVLLFLVAALSAPDAPTKPSTSNATSATSGAVENATLPRYAGKWQGADGTSIWIPDF